MQKVDKKAIRSYLAFLAEKQLSKKTIHRRLSCLRSFFTYLVKNKKLETNPLTELATPKLEKNPYFFKLSASRAITSAA